jgi:hypothetical protein
MREQPSEKLKRVFVFTMQQVGWTDQQSLDDLVEMKRQRAQLNDALGNVGVGEALVVVGGAIFVACAIIWFISHS